jgi:hypothetical protein
MAITHAELIIDTIHFGMAITHAELIIDIIHFGMKTHRGSDCTHAYALYTTHRMDREIARIDESPLRDRHPEEEWKKAFLESMHAHDTDMQQAESRTADTHGNAARDVNQQATRYGRQQVEKAHSHSSQVWKSTRGRRSKAHSAHKKRPHLANSLRRSFFARQMQ